METTDYGKFTYFTQNRPINESRVKRLMNSISSIGYMPGKAILVDQNNKVLDGQHRLEACKALKIPVVYAKKDLNGDDANKIILNLNSNQSIWRLHEYIRMHAKNGMECYKFAERIIKTYGLNTTCSILVSFKQRHNVAKEIREGIEIPIRKSADEIAQYVIKFDELGFNRKRSFVYAITEFYERSSRKQKAKLLRKMFSIHEQINPGEYMLNFEVIVNKYVQKEEERLVLTMR